MALTDEDKITARKFPKPVDIYAKGTPTQKAQERMNTAASRVVQPVIDTAKRNFQPVVNAAVTATGGNLVRRGFDRLAADSARNEQQLGNIRLASADRSNEIMREGLVPRFGLPTPRQAETVKPASQPTTSIREGWQERHPKGSIGPYGSIIAPYDFGDGRKGMSIVERNTIGPGMGKPASTSISERRPTLSAPQNEGKAFVTEVINGNRIDRVRMRDGSGSTGGGTFTDQNGRQHRNIETPFINGIQRVSSGTPNIEAMPSLTRNKELNAQMIAANQATNAARIDAFNAGETAWNKLNVEQPVSFSGMDKTNAETAEIPGDSQSKRELQAAQARGFNTSSDLAERELDVKEGRNKVMSDKNYIDARNDIEDPVERAHYDLANYDPEGPPSQAQQLGRTAARTMGQSLMQEFEEGLGMFKSDPTPSLVEKYFPPDMSPSVARSIVDSIGNDELRKKVGSYLKNRYRQ